MLHWDNSTNIDEHALQHISKNVTEGLMDIGSIVKTDIPEVFRPWFAQNHSKIGSILFVTVSTSGIVLCTDDYNQQLFYYRQTPIPRRVVFLTSGKTEEVEDITPNAPKTVSSKKVKWSSISGLTIVPYDEDVNRTHRRKEALLVADQDLHCLRVFKGINTLWRMAKDDIPVYKVVLTNISTSSFSPFSLHSGLPNVSNSHNRSKTFSDLPCGIIT